MTELKRRRRRAAPAGIAPNEPERDILDQYLYEVSTYPLLKGTEEIDLARKIRAGDQDALQELVKRNLRFVISVAKKYQNRGMAFIDLIGEGNVGLLTAARKFDPDSDRSLIERFVAEEGTNPEDEYMNRFVSEEIERALATLPARDAKVLRLYFGLDGGREHTLDEIGKLLGVTRERVRQLRDRALKRLRQGAVGEVLRDLSAA